MKTSRIAWFFNGDAFSGHGLLVADLAPFLDDIPVKGTRELFDSPELIAVPVPGPCRLPMLAEIAFPCVHGSRFRL